MTPIINDFCKITFYQMGSFKCDHYKQLIVTSFITLSGYHCLLSLLLKTKIVKTAIWKQLRSLYDKPTNQSVFLHYFTQLVPWGWGRLSFRLRIDLTISLGWTPNGSIFLNLESILKYKLPIEKEKIYLLACCVNFSYNIYMDQNEDKELWMNLVFQSQNSIL